MTREGRLEIYIYENQVIFHGRMSTEEAFDFINYFDKQGFKELMWGEENSCLCLTRKPKEDEKVYRAEDFCSPDEVFRLHAERDALKKKVLDLEALVRQVLEEYKRPEPEIEKQIKEAAKLSNPALPEGW